MKIITNNTPRPLLSGFELPPAARAEFDYYDDDGFFEASFFHYRGQWYDLAQFTRLDPGGPLGAAGWHGAVHETWFCGLVVKLIDELDDGPGVIVERYSE